MKKLVLLFVLLSGVYLILPAQTERLVLIEEATNASCGPCASQNPGFDALLNQNRDKLTAVKYHWYFPGYDPMHNHNTVENNARVGYYGINGVPTAVIDGVVPNGGGFGYPGQPSAYTQSLINQYYAVAAPFEMDMYHYLSPNEDSVYVIMRIKATQDIAGIMKAQMAVVEKHIHFSSAPGSNGETDFLDVMKKMLPDHEGTSIPSSWQAGDYSVIYESWKLQNIYNMDELGVVGFIQNATSKSVKQAANSEPEPFAPYYDTDVALTKISNLSETNCMGYVTPMVTLANFGANTLNSVDIVYQVNGENTLTYNWTGSLGFLDNQVVELPVIDFSVLDENEIVIYLQNPNGSTDDFPRNDTIAGTFDQALIAPAQVKLMIKLDDNPEEITWDVSNSMGDVIFSGGPYPEAGAFIQETMDFEESDCHIFSIYDSGGDGLNTPGFFTLFYGGNTQIIAGTSFGSRAQAQFSVDLGVSVEDYSNPIEVVVYPNPAVHQVVLAFSSLDENPVSIDVINHIGQVIKRIEPGSSQTGYNRFQIDLSDLDQGLYVLAIEVGTHKYSRKITIIR